MTYIDVIASREQALCHLLLFFSLYEDAAFKGEETYQVFSILQSYPLTATVDFPEEVNAFFDYKEDIEDIPEYFHYLVSIIGSGAPFLLLFHAAQVAMSDSLFTAEETEYLSLLGDMLGVDKPQVNTIVELALAERNLKMRGHF